MALRSVAVAHDKQSQAAAQAKHDKSVFFFGVVRVVNELGVLICEDRLRILKAHTMLAQVGCYLLGIPLKFKYSVSVRTLYIRCLPRVEGCLCGLRFELSGPLRQDAAGPE